MEPSPALILSFPAGTTAGTRDRLVALFADFDLAAIHEDDPIQPAVWTVHFADRESRDAAAAALGSLAEAEGIRVRSVDIEDDDWARRTQADLPAIRIGRVIIAPPWDLPTAEQARGCEVILIEPSRGFGTGHHQSTRLCLALLQARDLHALTVVDVGTGSGVLAIAAARLGAVYVSAIDVDPDAIENARENIERNGVADTVEAHVDDLSKTTAAPADVVTANLTGSLLERHASDLRRLVKPGGLLIASGFNVEERERVAEAFAPAFGLLESAEEDDWWAFVFGAGPREANPTGR